MSKLTMSIVLGAAMILSASSTATAGILSAGDVIANPGDLVAVPIDLSSIGSQDFTSIDVALTVFQSAGSGSTLPVLQSFAEPSSGSVWDPFSGVTPVQTLGDPTSVVGFSGNGPSATTVSNLNGNVFDLMFQVPASVSNGDVFTIELLEDSTTSNISLFGNAILPKMPGWKDGSISIVPEPAFGAAFFALLGVVGLLAAQRRKN